MYEKTDDNYCCSMTGFVIRVSVVFSYRDMVSLGMLASLYIDAMITIGNFRLPSSLSQEFVLRFGYRMLILNILRTFKEKGTCYTLMLSVWNVAKGGTFSVILLFTITRKCSKIAR